IIHKLDETLKEILDYYRNARLEINVERVDLNKLIEEGFERLKYHERSDQIHKEVSVDERFHFYSDGHRLSVVLNNLLSNAIKYRDVHKENQHIKIDVTVDKTNAVITFSDNGIGIS